ncbi:MAG: hypothetical protein ABR510_02805 [Trueperaceae bacterium]
MRRSTPLLVALLVAVALAPAFAAPHPQRAGDELSAGGWGARAPAWNDPGGRATGSSGGDAPRALPPTRAALRRQRAAPGRTPVLDGEHRARRPSLTALGRCQDDGG